MTQRAGDRVQRYLLDGGDEDLKRLLGLAEAHAEMARTALRRSGIARHRNDRMRLRPRRRPRATGELVG